MRWLIIGIILLGGYLRAPSTAVAGINFTFALSGSCTTSAGVYDGNNCLIKTLWSKRIYTSGTQAQDSWDGTLDDGTTAPAGNYQIRLLYNNMNYVWEGVIGNTDTSFTSSTVGVGYEAVWHGYSCIDDIVISGTDMFIANGYAEGVPNAYRASTAAPNTPKSMVYNGGVQDSATAFEYVATDGTWTYFASADDGFNNSSFVVAYKVADNTQAIFTSGTSFTPMPSWPSNTYSSVIDLTLSGTANLNINPIRGLAVQKSGNILAVSHSQSNEVRLFDKRGGQLLGSIAIAAPNKIAFNPNSGDLWVNSGTTVQRFTSAQVASVSATGTQLSAAATITGLASPAAVAVDPRAGMDLVLVADSGTSQQIKGFTSSGAVAPGWSIPLGTAGGYNATNGVNVTNTKFWFADPAVKPAPTYIAFLNDGSFWIGDPYNYRNLHFSSTQGYIEQIAFVPRNYVITVDPNAPTRVFGSSWLEYQVDYTKPLLPGDPGALGGNNSWKLVRNWMAGVPSNYFSGASYGLNTVTTLSNGRTYGLMRSSANTQDLVELPATGLLRITGTSLPASTSLYPNGDLRTSGTANGMQYVYNRSLTGFDPSGNPIWSGSSLLTSAPAGNKDPWFRGAWCGATGPQFPITDSNIVVSFEQSVINGGGNYNTGMHLGGMAVSGTSWMWRASTSGTTVDFFNPAQQNGTYDIGDRTNYGGNTVHALGRNVIYGFHGEGWKSCQANQFVHFYDDGLFVGQFGVPRSTYYSPAGAAGNSFCSKLIKVNGTTYFYHGDESCHGGIHRWRIDGADSVYEMAGWGTLGSSGTITLSGYPCFMQARFSGTGSGTGGANDLVFAGATGTIVQGSGSNSVTVSGSSPFTPSGGSYLSDNAGAAGTLGYVNITPSTSGPCTSWGKIFVLSGGKWLVNGGFDFFWSPNATPSTACYVRPIDISNNDGIHGLRIVFGNLSASTIRHEVITGSNGGGVNVTGTYTPGFVAGYMYHLGVTYSTDPVTGVTTEKIFAVAGTGPINTQLSTNLIGTGTFTLNPAVVTNTSGFLSGAAWAFGDTRPTGTVRSNDYDNVGLYSEVPPIFPGLSQ